jgi:hypothetical protein
MMKRYKEWSRRKKGVSGIIAATFLFAMIFTTGFAYFMFVQYNYQLQHQAAIERNQMDFDQSLEQFEVGGSVSNNKLYAQVNNTGPVAITIVHVFFINGTTGAFIKDEPINPGITINPGTKATVGNGINYASGDILIKVVSGRGKVVSGQWPPPPSPEALVAELATAVGPVMVWFEGFKWAATNSTGALSGVNVNSLQWNDGWQIKEGTKGVIWRVEIVNQYDKDIILDKFSVFWIINPAATPNTEAWHIMRVDSENRLQKYTTGAIIIPKNPNPGKLNTATITLYFAANNPGDDSPVTMPSGTAGESIWTVFLTLSGSYDAPYSGRYTQTLIPIQAIVSTP